MKSPVAAAAVLVGLAAPFCSGLTLDAVRLSPASVPLGASFRASWTVCSVSPSPRTLFSGGASAQTFVDGSAVGSSLVPWVFVNDTCATGEFSIPLSQSGVASVDLVLLSSGIHAPAYGAPEPSSVLGRIPKPIQVTVDNSVAQPRDSGADVTVGLYWEPWFTPLNFGRWPLAEALPSLATYESSQPGVARQHGLWFVSAGIGVVPIDWTNNLWNCQTFSCRRPNVRELMNDTQLALGVWQGMRATEGIAVPPALLLMGLDNGPVAALQAIEEQCNWTAKAVLQNQSAGGQAAMLHDPVTSSPLVVLFDGTLQNHSSLTSIGPWGVRLMGSQLQNRPSAAYDLGYWSWMDGVINPIITPLPSGEGTGNGAVTVSSAFFAGDGWLGDGAMGKRGGATLLESWIALHGRVGRTPTGSLAIREIYVNQMNEFAGQQNGGGYGPDKDRYVDIYSSELGNDMEPTDLRSCAYRRPGVACGGYGWRQLNLLRFLTAWSKDQSAAAHETILAVDWPPVGWSVNGSSSLQVSVLWAQFDGTGAPTAPGHGTAAPPASALTVEVEQSSAEGWGRVDAVPSTGSAGDGTIVTIPTPAVCSTDPSALFVVRVCTPHYSSSWKLLLREDDASYPTGQPAPACVEHAITCGIQA